MNFTTGVTLITASLVILTALVFFLTRSPLSLFILLLLFGVRTLFEVKCPKCGEEFTPFYKDDKKPEQAKDLDKK